MIRQNVNGYHEVSNDHLLIIYLAPHPDKQIPSSRIRFLQPCITRMTMPRKATNAWYHSTLGRLCAIESRELRYMAGDVVKQSFRFAHHHVDPSNERIRLKADFPRRSF